MFHAGHVEFLEKAKKFGDYLIVGIHSDAVVNSHRGLNYPLMSMHERALSVLGCKVISSLSSLSHSLLCSLVDCLVFCGLVC